MSRDIALDDSDSPPAKRQRTEESPGDESGRVSEGSGDGDGEGNHDASDASGSSSGSSSSYSSDSDSSSELDQVVGSELILETRKFLKENGTIKFLEKYLPMTATAEDIIKVIIQLGFLPRNLPSADTPIFELVQILQRAMKSVRSMRTRLHDFTTVEQAVEKIKAANKILVITGAGISTSLGIPDFRSSKGFYAKIEHLGFSDPQEVFDLDLFHADPSVFYSIAHMILPPDKAYTPLHEFIKVLQDKDKLLRNYTQNIDDIESHVGLDRGKVIQCHGSFAFASCVTCGFQVKGEELFPQIRAQEIPYCPRCFKTREKLMNNDESYVPESYGVMKPDITFFGEPLPKRFHQMIREDITECDLVISAGTSLKVAPVADIVSKIDEKVPQILLNKDPISHCNFDVSLLGYCDDAACYLSKKLGDTWKLTHEHANSVNLTVEQIDAEERLFQVNKL